MLPPGTTFSPEDDPYGPYVALSREQWSDLAEAVPWELDAGTLARLRGLGDPTTRDEVRTVYHPLTQLLNLYWERTGALFGTTHDFLGLTDKQVPFVIGVAGSVAVGKSTTARLLQELLARGPRRPKVDLITTDGFLYPNHILEAMGIAHRKGFPESYDRQALLQFVVDVKSGKSQVTAPVYSHLIYDIVEDERTVVDDPDILIIEGLNVLQPARRRSDGSTALAVSDFFDFTVYVDARTAFIRQWYINRFFALRATAFRDPASYFRRYAQMTQAEALHTAETFWDTINGPNLELNIRPTRGRATAILRKGEDHRVNWVRIRKV
ncbi:type I pantothenate kinase [Micropruina sp. KQZ13P-5]|nr:type I pantothenate kinase [Micropruina sp. KQZ13P-5]MCW3156933.1 type I pantothenate kinase [Micropruina sp. KQZ13P-5]